MPRPGPRPYECVRRAWHSDRHQPIRGSLIQEIFRVVNEIHCPATKKNKEWQEKLPIVVLKAEEIMYSKANSETEYMDLETLLDRTNDAINTIIRRDEGTETGGLLQPCIEAALTLGCTPRRASRSQRNSGPQYYLSGSTQEPAGFLPNMLEKATKNDQNSNWQTNSVMNLGIKNHSLYSEKVIPCNDNLGLHIQPQPLSNLCSVYPLYYGSFPEVKTPLCNFRFADNCSSEAVQSDKEVMFDNLKTISEDSSNKKSEIKCDLSLRLGPHSPRVAEGVGHSDFLPEMSKFNNTSLQMDGGRTFFPQNCMVDPFNHLSDKMSMSLKKQKLLYSNNVEDQRSSWFSEFSCGFVRGVPRNSSS